MIQSDLTCSQFEQLLLLDQDGALTAEERRTFRKHADSCAQCRDLAAGYDQVNTMYRELDHPTISARSLDHLLDGLPASRKVGRARKYSGLPLVAALVIGFLLGALWRAPDAEVLSQVRQEVSMLRTQWVLGALRDHKATVRLEGVARGLQLDHAAIQDAFLSVLAHDPSSNVRMAVIHGLYQHPDLIRLQPGIQAAFAFQSDPMVQIALIDLIGTCHNQAAATFLAQLAGNPELTAEVREHAAHVGGGRAI